MSGSDSEVTIYPATKSNSWTKAGFQPSCGRKHELATRLQHKLATPGRITILGS